MGERRAGLIVVLFCFCLLVSTPGIAFASSENWVEVTRFTGKGYVQGNTEPFTIHHVEWRIKYEFSKVTDFGMQDFRFFVVPDENYVSDGNFTYVTGNIADFDAEEKNGTYYIDGHYGVFRLGFAVTTVKEFTIIVEQNIDSIPEFPSWIILPLFIVATSVVVIVSNKKRRENKIT